jgi:hypothetical protein
MQAGILLACLLLALFLPAVTQPQGYHAFADDRTLLGIPHFWNTVSNLPFIIVGIAGLRALWGPGSPASVRFASPGERWAYLAFFAGVLLTGLGSAWYHLAPDDARLFWDRLPIALISGALVVAIHADHRVGNGGSRHIPDLVATLCISAGTVLYWAWGAGLATGLATGLGAGPGDGNLTPYLLLHAYVVVSVVAILVAGTPRYTRRVDVVTVIGLYGLARAAEWLDAEVYFAGHLLSGHTLKHLFAALATAWLLRMILHRSIQAPEVVTPAGIA